MYKFAEPGSPEQSWLWIEQRLLGALLNRPELYGQLKAMLPEDAFTIRIHATIWKSVHLAVKSQKPVSIASIVPQLQTFIDNYMPQDLEARPVDAATYLNFLAVTEQMEREEVGMKAHDPMQLATEMREGHSRHLISTRLDKLQASIREGTPLAMVEAGLRGVMEGAQTSTGNADVNATEAARRTMEMLTEKQTDGFHWGMKCIEDLTGLIRRKEYSVVLAKSGGAKTAFALSVAYNVLKQGGRVRFITLEMGVEELMMRFFARESGVPYAAIYRRDMNEVRIRELNAAGKHLGKLPLVIDDRSFLSIDDIYASCARQKQTEGLDLIIVDHLSNISVPDTTHIGKEAEKKGYAFKAMAKDLDCHVIGVSQVNQAALAKDSSPSQSNMRDGPGGAQAPSIMIELRKKKKDKEDDSPNHIIEATLVKNRHGPEGEQAKLTFNTDRMALHDSRDRSPFGDTVFE